MIVETHELAKNNTPLSITINSSCALALPFGAGPQVLDLWRWLQLIHERLEFRQKDKSQDGHDAIRVPKAIHCMKQRGVDACGLATKHVHLALTHRLRPKQVFLVLVKDPDGGITNYGEGDNVLIGSRVRVRALLEGIGCSPLVLHGVGDDLEGERDHMVLGTRIHFVNPFQRAVDEVVLEAIIPHIISFSWAGALPEFSLRSGKLIDLEILEEAALTAKED